MATTHRSISGTTGLRQIAGTTLHRAISGVTALGGFTVSALVWILETGLWNDSGIWDDTANWVD